MNIYEKIDCVIMAPHYTVMADMILMHRQKHPGYMIFFSVPPAYLCLFIGYLSMCDRSSELSYELAWGIPFPSTISQVGG